MNTFKRIEKISDSFHNFVQLFLKLSRDEPDAINSLFELLEKYNNPTVLIYKIATRHFREARHTSSLVRSLKLVLGHASSNLELIYESFVKKNTVQKYLTVCLLLAEIM